PATSGEQTEWCRTWASSPGASFRPGAISRATVPADADLRAVMAKFHEREKLVDCEEVADAVAQLPGHVAGVIPECLDCLARLPPALVLERLRQVPVVERGERCDPRRDQFVHQAVVEVQALEVWLTCPVREDPRPGDGEAVRGRAEVLHQGDVFLVAMVMVVGDVAGGAVADLPLRVRVCVPDRWAFAVLVPCALDLVCRGGRAPEEAFRELA